MSVSPSSLSKFERSVETRHGTRSSSRGVSTPPYSPTLLPSEYPHLDGEQSPSRYQQCTSDCTSGGNDDPTNVHRTFTSSYSRNSLPESTTLQPLLEFIDVEDYLSNTSSSNRPQRKKQKAGTGGKRKGASNLAASTAVHWLNVYHSTHSFPPLTWDLIRSSGRASPGWLGSVTIGTDTLQLHEPERTKKDVKEVLARKALELLSPLSEKSPNPSVTNATTKARSNVEDWVAILHTFCQRSRDHHLPQYQYTCNLSEPFGFNCSCTVAQSVHPVEPKGQVFSTKKEAKRAAAREAVEYLIAQGFAAPYFWLKRTGGSVSCLMQIDDAASTTARELSLDLEETLWSKKLDCLVESLSLRTSCWSYQDELSDTEDSRKCSWKTAIVFRPENSEHANILTSLGFEGEEPYGVAKSALSQRVAEESSAKFVFDAMNLAMSGQQRRAAVEKSIGSEDGHSEAILAPGNDLIEFS
ncbi:Interferon-induced, double-stranded RNA-activated protein kinase [Agyrium rufum]|nr:Interferon-induced, double-stranded RNA-activated protein kinase [Agyrium rufum]